MTERSASVLVCDNILFDVTGKAYLHGLYPGDITMPGDELLVNQLVFYFTIQAPKTTKMTPFEIVTLRVTPPGATMSELSIPVANLVHAPNPNRPFMILRAPLLIQQLVLRPGKIETKVIVDGEEIDAGGF